MYIDSIRARARKDIYIKGNRLSSFLSKECLKCCSKWKFICCIVNRMIENVSVLMRMVSLNFVYIVYLSVVYCYWGCGFMCWDLICFISL